MVEEGHLSVDIAKVLGRSKSTTSKVFKRFRSHGLTENMPRNGRPKIVGDRGLVKLNRCQQLRENAAASCEKCSVKTVQRNLHLLGYKRRSVRKRVNISAVNKRKRIYWCRNKLTWSFESN